MVAQQMRSTTTVFHISGYNHKCIAQMCSITAVDRVGAAMVTVIGWILLPLIIILVIILILTITVMFYQSIPSSSIIKQDHHHEPKVVEIGKRRRRESNETPTK